jgi:hypothetical protein
MHELPITENILKFPHTCQPIMQKNQHNLSCGDYLLMIPSNFIGTIVAEPTIFEGNPELQAYSCDSSMPGVFYAIQSK